MRRPGLLLALAGLCLVAAAVRHRFVWGGAYAGVLGVFEGALLLGFAGFGTAALLAERGVPGDAAARARTWRLGVLFVAFGFVAPPFLTTDLFDYVLRGRVEAVHGANPYLHPPAEFPHDPLLAHAQWPGFVMPYGPLSALLQAAIAKVGGGIWVGVYLWKLAMALCHVGLAWCYARVRPLDVGGLRLVLWNPFLVLELANGAHNDGLMALCLAVMVERLARGSHALATFAFGCAVLTKHGCVVLGPLLLALAVRERRLPAFGLGVLASTALTALCAWRWFLEPGALAFLTKQLGNRGTSLQAFALRFVGEEHAGALVKAGYAGVLLVLGWACVRLRSLADFGRLGTLVVLVFLVIAMPLFSPWYHLWWLPLAALLGRPGALLTTLAALAPASYLVFATTRSFALDHQVWQWLLALGIPCWVFGRRGLPLSADSRVQN